MTKIFSVAYFTPPSSPDTFAVDMIAIGWFESISQARAAASQIRYALSLTALRGFLIESSNYGFDPTPPEQHWFEQRINEETGLIEMYETPAPSWALTGQHYIIGGGP